MILIDLVNVLKKCCSIYFEDASQETTSFSVRPGKQITSITPITYISKKGNVVSLSNRCNTGYLSYLVDSEREEKKIVFLKATTKEKTQY